MLVYQATKNEFIQAVRTNQIDQVIETEVLRKLHRRSPANEVTSWKNSLQYMMNVLLDEDIPSTAGVAIEYNIPLTNNRIDFVLSGKDANYQNHAVIVELKQWSEAEKTDLDAIVKTRLGGGVRETNHPSYQAWTYSEMIHEYNETVRDEGIQLRPCAYLHNMRDGSAINDAFYANHTDKAPVFLSRDAQRLSEFLKQYVKYGDSDNIMYRIDHGKIKPSKNLADSLRSMIDGNQEFLMLDAQKLVYEKAISLAHAAGQKKAKKQVLIVSGGPGTGKSVVAINLLVEFTRREMLTQYVSKNAAPRQVFSSLLKGTRKKTVIDNMFKGSGSYTQMKADTFDVLMIDEAHRLNEKSGLYANLGENQIKELISSARTTVFFLDEAQRVTLQDIGTSEEIERWASHFDADVVYTKLTSQFRCNGSDAYLSWIDQTLGIRDTAHDTLEDVDYEVIVFDDPCTLHRAIMDKNRLNNKARIVAGYCWDWNSKKDPKAYDIEIPEHEFAARWNLTKDGSLWMIAEESVHEVGCIHTCQGLEAEYIGVIIGDDFLIRDGQIVTDGLKRSKNDRSIRGFKTLLKKEPDIARSRVDEIIKNTYRTLMTRGQKGCYIYSVDEETNAYFKAAVNREPELEVGGVAHKYPEIPYLVVDFENAKPYEGYVPVFNVAAAAGSFSDVQLVEEADWLELPETFASREGMFVARVVGESMNKRIPNGAWCLFVANPGGSRNGKIVLVEHRDISDPDHGGSYTIKRYRSEKILVDGEPVNESVTLSPETTAYGYKKIVVEAGLEDLKVIGEFVAVL